MRKLKIVMATFLVAGVGYVSFGTNSEAAVSAIGGCECPDVYDPVCIIETGQQFSNSCRASCAGYTPADWVSCDSE